MLRLLLVPFLCISSLAAQDMVGVSWTGSVVRFDSFTGTSSVIGNLGANANSLARDAAGQLWTVQRPAATWELAVVNPQSGTSTAVAPASDTRGLAWHQGQLFAVQLVASGNQLATIDPGTGVETVLGQIGYSAVQALCSFDGVLYAWDVAGGGLLTLDPSTGDATDVNASIGTNNVDVQWLARRADGRLVGGNSSIYILDTTSGVPTLVAGGGSFDLRGAEPLQDYVRSFGSGCNGGGGQVSSSATIGSGPGAMLTLQSNHHDVNAIGMVVFGLSDTQSNGLPLPVSIDPVFGTSGCTLYVSLDVSLLTITSATFPATLTLQVPLLASWPGRSLFAQHAVLENVPGGLSLSDAVVVQFGY